MVGKFVAVSLHVLDGDVALHVILLELDWVVEFYDEVLGGNARGFYGEDLGG